MTKIIWKPATCEDFKNKYLQILPTTHKDHPITLNAPCFLNFVKFITTGAYHFSNLWRKMRLPEGSWRFMFRTPKFFSKNYTYITISITNFTASTMTFLYLCFSVAQIWDTDRRVRYRQPPPRYQEGRSWTNGTSQMSYQIILYFAPLQHLKLVPVEIDKSRRKQ